MNLYGFSTLAAMVAGLGLSLNVQAAQNGGAPENYALSSAFAVVKCTVSNENCGGDSCNRSVSCEIPGGIQQSNSISLTNCEDNSQGKFCYGEWKSDQTVDGVIFSANVFVFKNTDSLGTTNYGIGGAANSPATKNSPLSSGIYVSPAGEALADTTTFLGETYKHDDKDNVTYTTYLTLGPATANPTAVLQNKIRLLNKKSVVLQ